jgi:hypothetical protein
LFFVSLKIDILTGLKWNLNIVLICISLMVKDIEHFFMYLLPIRMSSFEKCLFRSFVHLMIGLLVHLLLHVL